MSDAKEDVLIALNHLKQIGLDLNSIIKYIRRTEKTVYKISQMSEEDLEEDVLCHLDPEAWRIKYGQPNIRSYLSPF